jgi:hypothetical protein
MLAAIAAVGLLLLAYFLSRSGSAVAVFGAIGIALALGIVAFTAFSRTLRQSRHPQPSNRPPPTSNRPPVPPSSLPSPQPSNRTVAQSVPSVPVSEAHVASQHPERLQYAAAQLAQIGVDTFQAPSAAVLVPAGNRLTAAGSAGDWVLARQQVREEEVPGVGRAAPSSSVAPEFPLDPQNDWLQRLLGQIHSQPIPMERWQELSDVPPALLPLAGLASSGIGVAVPLAHRGRFVGLWLLAQRPNELRYTDAELSRLKRYAGDLSQTLGAAMER